MSTKYLDYSGLTYFWNKLKTLFGGKADKVASATSGNFAGLDANGNLVDSGHKHSDYVGSATTVNGHALSSDVTVTKSDIGLGDVTNDAQVKRSEMGVASGVATLDANGLVPTSQLPSYVDDVVEAYPVSGATELSADWLSATSGGSALTPEGGKIYVLVEDTTSYGANSQFRWSGTAYVKLADGGVSAITNAEIDTICV